TCRGRRSSPGDYSSRQDAKSVRVHLWTVSPPRPLTSFAAVMATGIVWLDAAAEGLGGLSLALLAIGLAVYVALAARALAHPAEVPAELGDPVRALSALAIVAGTGVLAACIARAPVDVLALGVGGGASVGIAAATVAARRRRGRASRGHAE